MPNFTPVYRLPFAKSGEPISAVMERTRYMAIDRQLEALFTFLGNGVITGWNINPSEDDQESVVVTAGSGVVLESAVATNQEYTFQLTNDTTQSSTINYFYVRSLRHTPHTAAGEIVTSTELIDDPSYLLLGTVTVTSDWNITIDDTTASGRQQLSLLKFLLESLADHLHTGVPGEPSKIDLFNHVKGILSAANIEDLPASKITSGTFGRDRFKISHKDLEDIGTLTHSELDTLIEKFQSVNALLFGDAMTANLIQLILSLKHVWSDVDDYLLNFNAVIPGIGDDTFGNSDTHMDINATTAEIDYDNHRIRGKFLESKEIGQYIVNSVSEFSTDGVDGGSTFDSRYISISSNVGGTNVYGYGYGYGEGLDYFDVLEAATGFGDTVYGVTGDETGEGTSTFESTFAFSYGFGYGYEDIPIFGNTLFSTNVTLVPTSSSLTLHDKFPSDDDVDSDNYYIGDSGNGESIEYSTDTTDYTPEQFRYLMQISYLSTQEGTRYTDIEAGLDNRGSFHAFHSASFDTGLLPKRDDDQACMYLLWDDSLDMTSDEYFHIELQQVLYRMQTNSSGRVLADYIKPGTSEIYSYEETFDSYWSPDASMDLIIEVTREYGGKTYKHFYKYVDRSVYGAFSQGGTEPDYRFLDVTDNTIFLNNLETAARDDLNTPATALLQARIIADNLWEIKAADIGGTNSTGGFEYITSVGLTDSSYNTYIPLTSGAYPGLSPDTDGSTIIQNITGIFLYTRNDYDGPRTHNGWSATARNYLFSHAADAGDLRWPQGQRFTNGEIDPDTEDFYPEYEPQYLTYQEDLITMQSDYPTASEDTGAKEGSRTLENGVVKEDNIYRESKMFVDLGRLFLGTQYGYRYNEELNVVEDITVTFPTTVDFNSISWVSSEPSNSIVYLQIKRLSTGIGDEEDDNYNENVIYTNKGSDLLAAQSDSSLRGNREPWLDVDAEFLPSGSDFPSEYEGIRSIAIKAVLLPSTPDLRVSPVLNSITINYTSNTVPGSLTIESESEWEGYRSISNIVPKTTVDGTTDYMALDVPIQDETTGKVKNLIYGTRNAVVEHSNVLNVWGSQVKRYVGDGSDGSDALPKTFYQYILSDDRQGIEGFVTHLKKQENGDIVFLDQHTFTTGSRIITVDRDYILKKLVISEPAYKGTSGSGNGQSRGTLYKAVYNSNLGDYGALYLVFTHELQCYQDMYTVHLGGVEKIEDGTYKPQQSTDDRNQTVNLSQMRISFKGVTLNLSNAEAVIPCGRGIICVLLNDELKNMIESLSVPQIKVIFDAAYNEETEQTELKDVIDSDGNLTSSCVSFYGDNIAGTAGTVTVNIQKPSYDVIYAPIEGTVAMDVDEDDIYYLLKVTRPYSATADGDDYPTEPWYVSFDSSTYWQGWAESTKTYQATKSGVFDPISAFRESDWQPNFYLNAIYGYRGCIQKKDNYLLITISADVDANGNKNGILLFKKDSDGNYYTPSEPYLITDSDLYPMAARFDEATYDTDQNVYGDIYIALSDLKISSGGDEGKSKVIKLRETSSEKIIWQWGSEAIFNAGTAGTSSFIITANDIKPLSYKKDGITEIGEDDVEVVVST